MRLESQGASANPRTQCKNSLDVCKENRFHVTQEVRWPAAASSVRREGSEVCSGTLRVAQTARAGTPEGERRIGHRECCCHSPLQPVCTSQGQHVLTEAGHISSGQSLSLPVASGCHNGQGRTTVKVSQYLSLFMPMAPKKCLK